MHAGKRFSWTVGLYFEVTGGGEVNWSGNSDGEHGTHLPTQATGQHSERLSHLVSRLGHAAHAVSVQSFCRQFIGVALDYGKDPRGSNFQQT